MVQWLRLLVPNAGGPGSNPGQETRSRRAATKRSCTRQRRPHVPQLRPGAAQREKIFFFLKRRPSSVALHKRAVAEIDLIQGGSPFATESNLVLEHKGKSSTSISAKASE